MSGAGDVNGDGLGDFIVGARGDSSNGPYAGAVYVFSGADGSRLHVLHGEKGAGTFGWSVSDVADLNGDGFDDFMAGAPGTDYAGADSGSVYVFSGADGSMRYRRFDGESAQDRFGFSVSGAGDVNGDGYRDVVARGRSWVRVFSGADGSALQTISDRRPQSFFDMSVSAGDMNGDGLGDVIVAGHDWRSVSVFSAGRRRKLRDDRPLLGPGESVGALFPDLLVDPDPDSAGGIAVRLASGPGRWQYSLDGGLTYEDCGAIDASRSLLLRETDYIRYVAAGDADQSVALVFVGWDQTSGLPGARSAHRSAAAPLPLLWLQRRRWWSPDRQSRHCRR